MIDIRSYLSDGESERVLDLVRLQLLVLGALDALDEPAVDVELLGELGELFAAFGREVCELVRVALED